MKNIVSNANFKKGGGREREKLNDYFVLFAVVAIRYKLTSVFVETMGYCSTINKTGIYEFIYFDAILGRHE